MSDDDTTTTTSADQTRSETETTNVDESSTVTDGDGADSDGAATDQQYGRTEPPRDLVVPDGTHETLNDLPDEVGMFAECQVKDLYVLAAAYGFHEGVHDTGTGRNAIAQRDTLTDTQRMTLNSIAVAHEDDPRVLHDGSAVDSMVREYVVGGAAALAEDCAAADAPRSLLADVTMDVFEG